MIAERLEISLNFELKLINSSSSTIYKKKYFLAPRPDGAVDQVSGFLCSETCCPYNRSPEMGEFLCPSGLNVT